MDINELDALARALAALLVFMRRYKHDTWGPYIEINPEEIKVADCMGAVIAVSPWPELIPPYLLHLDQHQAGPNENKTPQTPTK